MPTPFCEHDRLRELQAELADLRRLMGLPAMPGRRVARVGGSEPRLPSWPARNWMWPSKAEREHDAWKTT